MIRSNAPSPAVKRRIAVIDLPRFQKARLGSIGTPPPPVFSWTPTRPQEPSSADNWIAYIIQRQNRASETTPGTLTYTPAPLTFDPVIAPWNSWNLGTCESGPAPVQSETYPTTVTAEPDITNKHLLAVLLGALAVGTIAFMATNAKKEKQ
jgi:hypothetical protein